MSENIKGIELKGIVKSAVTFLWGNRSSKKKQTPTQLKSQNLVRRPSLRHVLTCL